jgi:hypothetical protein
VEPVVGVDDDGATGGDDAKAFLEECLNGERSVDVVKVRVARGIGVGGVVDAEGPVPVRARPRIVEMNELGTVGWFLAESVESIWPW